MSTSVRQLVREIQEEVSNGNLMPARASELLTRLSALLGNINAEILDRDVEYNQILLFWLEKEEKAVRAKIRAECTPEYRMKIEARNTRELAAALISSLKYLLRNQEEEYMGGRHQ